MAQGDSFAARERIRIGLHFPRGWAVALPEHAREMETRAEAWLRDRGVIHDDAGAEKLAKLAVAEYANWPFASAEPERAEVITKFLALWIFYDDVIEERDDGQAARIHDAIAGRPAHGPDGNAHLHCWWELGRACAQVMSPAWVERHADRFTEWVTSVRMESIASAKFRAKGVPPSASEHLERRRLNIGMVPNVDFIEYQMGRELTPALHDDDDILRVTALAAEVVAIINDLFGLAKDRRLRWPNLVSCVQHELGGSLERAFEAVVTMLDERIAEITAVEARLLARVRERELVEAWLRGLHHVMYGFARWHAMAPRYTSTHGLEDGRVLQLVMC
jgi:hypothetical protein